MNSPHSEEQKRKSSDFIGEMRTAFTYIENLLKASKGPIIYEKILEMRDKADYLIRASIKEHEAGIYSNSTDAYHKEVLALLATASRLIELN